MKQLTINPELKALIPPLTEEEFKQLQANVLADGIREPIITWNGTIVDGHNRYELSQMYDLPFQILEIEFENKDYCKKWMAENQLGRRNLSDFVKGELIDFIRDIERQIGKEKQLQTLKKGIETPDLSIIDKTEIHDTRKIVSEKLGWSTGKVAMFDVVKKHAPEEIKAKLRTGEVSINQAYQHIKGEQEKKNHYAQVAEKIKANDIKPQSELNEIIAQEFDVKHGDIYLINDRHILIVADAVNDIKYILKNCPKIDCVLTDPPYGISYKSPTGNGLTQRGDYKIIQGDEQEFDPSILFNYSKNVITWGANHYANKLDNSPGWLIWDKRDGEAINNNSDCEMAWSNMIGSARLWHHKWNGMIKDSERGEKRIHPTQKPIKLYEWCIEITKTGQVIIDPFAGSGIIIPSCHNTERTAIAVEKDYTYAAAILNRMISFGYKVNKK
jgi:DNA modification methylase